MKVVTRQLAAALLLSATQPSIAAELDLAERVAACARERDDAQRLQCFDSAAAQSAEAHAAASLDASPVTRDTRPAAAASSEDFGVRGSELARKRDAAVPEQERAPQRIDARVTGISKRPRGELVFTLDNGQLWVQKAAGAHFPIKVGDPVTILAGTLGSFRLVVGNRSTQVTRVQ